MIQAFIFVLFFTFISMGTNCFGQGGSPGPTYFSQLKIIPSVSLTPTYSVNNVESIDTPNAHWILIEVNFSPVEKQAQNEPPGVFELQDNMSIGFEVLLSDKKKVFLLSTKVDYWSVSFDGKEKHAMVCIPPAILRRYTPPSTKLGKPFLKDLPIKITFYLNGAPVQKEFYPDRKAGAVFQSLETNPNVIRVPNTILDRSQTPWFNVSFDRFELIKPKTSVQ